MSHKKIITRPASFGKISWTESKEKKQKVWDFLIAKFMEHESFNGESVMQNDSINIASPEILSEIAEMIKFEVEYQE